MADLYISEETADDIETAAVDAALDGRFVVVRESERLIRAGTSARHGHRHLLLPALHALQNAKGWISPGGLNYVCETLQVPPAEAYGVATFYDLFRVEEPAQAGDVTHVCVDAACQIAGAAERIAELKAQGVNVHESPCLGQCERANHVTGEVAVFVQGVGGPDSVAADDTPYELFHQKGDESLRLLKRIGVVDPTSLDSYRADGGYESLTAAIEMGAEAVCTAVADSGLSGRGGAAFPTGIKWRAVAAEQGVEAMTVDELLAHPEVDVVLNLTIPLAHADVALRALAAGKHVYGEKPLALTTAEAEPVLARAAELGLG